MKTNTVSKFFKLLQPDRKDIFYLYIFAIFSGIINLTLPLGVQAIIGLIMGAQISVSLILLISFVLLGVIFAGVLLMMQMWVAEAIQQKIFVRIAFNFAHRLPRIKLESVKEKYLPEIVNRFFDTLTIQKGLTKILIDLLGSSIQMVFGLILLAFYHPVFIVFGLFLFLVLFLLFRISSPKAVRTSLEESENKYKLVFWLEEIARHHRNFKASGGKKIIEKNTDKNLVNWLTFRKQHFQVLLSQYGFLIGFKTLITAGLLVLGSNLVLNEQISLGQFVAAEIVIILVLSSVEKIILSMDTIYDVLTAAEKLSKVDELPLNRESGVSFEIQNAENGIAVKTGNLSFFSEIRNSNMLDDINLDILPGEKVCIAGSGNSGKSLLLRIMAGMYEDFDGSISYDGIPLRNINPEALQQNISVYFGQSKLFAGTIYDNLTLGENISFERLNTIAEITGLRYFIDNLSNGYDTEVIPEDFTLSDSVKTKILLSRCLLCNPRLFLIENFLEQLSENEKYRVINLLTDKDCTFTLVAISHYRAFAEKCDKIVLLKDGRIEMAGTFEEVSKHPDFNSLFTQ